jgi:peptidoglycan/LPS O-acetylase OafA/YrhL
VSRAAAPPAWGPVTFHGGGAPAPAASIHPPPRGPLAYAPGLDGVRALAVVAVVVFHVSARVLPGGFLGVDVFFTLSGFLITAILLAEFCRRGSIDIRRFYLRRARRLLPALFLMLSVVTVAAWLVDDGQLAQLRGDVLAALSYSTNWTQIVWARSYFGQLDTPSLLQHLWSLAVEEQFYLLWPVLLVAAVAFGRRRSLLRLPLGLAGGSLVVMAVLYHPGADPARVYYGTDTHVAPMLIGAALAVLVASTDSSRRLRPRRALVDMMALGGLVTLGWACVHVGYYSGGLYRGGYLLIGLASAGVIWAASRRDTVFGALLGTAPLVWLGQRSYAIYLWHWPILVLAQAKLHHPVHGPAQIGVALAVTVAISDLSFRLVERPIRTRGLGHVLRGTHPAPGAVRGPRRPPHQRRRLRLAALAGTSTMTVAVVAALASASAPAAVQVDTGKRITISVPTTAGVAPRSGAARTHVPSQPPFARPVRVSFFGDSQGMTLLINKPNGLAGVLTLTDSTVEGCGVLLGTIHSQVGYTRDLSSDCGSWPEQWAKHAQQNKPQIAVVELGAWDVFDTTISGHHLIFGTPAWDAYYLQQLTHGISILLDAGAQVALLGVPCYHPVPAGGLPVLPERGMNARTRHVTSLLETAAARDPQRVFMISPPTAFCTNPAIAANTSYRWDGTHFYIPGAALMFQTITPQLLAIPQPPPS